MAEFKKTKCSSCGKEHNKIRVGTHEQETRWHVIIVENHI